MTKLFLLSLSGLSVGLLLLSFHYNVIGVNVMLILISLLFSLISSFLSFVIDKRRLNFRLKTYNIFLILFVFVLLFKLLIEHPDNYAYFPYLLGSSGGVVFFFLIGLICKFNPIFDLRPFSTIQSPKFFKYYSSVLLLICLFLCCLTAITSYSEFSLFISYVRNDLFLVDSGLLKEELGFQRIGDFIMIRLSILTLLFSISLSMLSQRAKPITSYLQILIQFLFLLLTAISIGFSTATSLLVGSNKAAVFSIALIPFIIYLVLFTRFDFPKLFSYQMLSIPRKLTRLSLPHLNTSFLKFIFFVFAFCFVCLLSIDLDFFATTRLLRFGDGSGLFDSRIQLLLSNFWIHFDVAPFWGHIYAEGLTTGEGSYIHSLPFYLLVNTGALGLFLFLAYIIILTKEKYAKLSLYIINIFNSDNTNSRSSFLMSKYLYNCSLLYILFFSILVATTATSVFWGFLWFCLGLSFTTSNIRSIIN